MVDYLADNRRFMLQMEQTIQMANREVIHKQIAPITSERMVSFAVAVAKLRASYIKLAFKFADGKDGEAEIEELDIHQKRFEVARDAFIALQRTIELGYVTVE